MLGGKSRIMPADETVQKLCVQVQSENGLQGYRMFRAIEYRRQIVAGVNYFIKVKVDDDGSCIYLKVYVDLTGKAELIGLEEGFNLSSQFL